MLSPPHTLNADASMLERSRALAREDDGETAVGLPLVNP